MSTNTNVTPNPMDALLAMQQQIAALLERATAPTVPTTPDAVPVAPTPAPSAPKRTRKSAAASASTVAPAPAHSPVVATAANGMKINITEPYRAMVEFTRKAIQVLSKADGSKSKGIHSVYSGFNQAFGQHFNLAKEQVYTTVDLMTERGDIGSRFCKGGKMLYLPGDMPTTQRANVSDVLAKILG